MIFLHSIKRVEPIPLENYPRKETTPWKRTFRFSVKVYIYLKPFICLKYENVNIENKATTGKTFLNFWNLAFQNEKMDREWTDLPFEFNPHFIGSSPEIKYILISPKNPNFKDSNPSTTLAGVCTMLWGACVKTIIVW